MKTYIKLISFFCICILLSSCSKKDNSTSLDTHTTPINMLQWAATQNGVLNNPFGLLNKIQTEGDAYIYLNCQGTLPVGYTNGSLNAEFKKTVFANTGILKVGNNNFSPSYPFGYAQVNIPGLPLIYGKDTPVEINYTYNGAARKMVLNYTMPEKIEIIQDGNFMGSNVARLAAGTKLSWKNEATGQPTYVMIEITYEPTSYANGLGQGRSKTKTLVLEDNGSYTFTANDIADFPNNVFLDVDIHKGNFQFVKHDVTGLNFFVGASSTMMLSARCTK